MEKMKKYKKRKEEEEEEEEKEEEDEEERCMKEKWKDGNKKRFLPFLVGCALRGIEVRSRGMGGISVHFPTCERDLAVNFAAGDAS